MAQGMGSVARGAGLAWGAGFGRDGRAVDSKEGLGLDSCPWSDLEPCFVSCLAEETGLLPALLKDGLVCRSEENVLATGADFFAEYGDAFGLDVGLGRFWVGMTVSCGARGLSRMACAMELFALSCLISSYQSRCGYAKLRAVLRKAYLGIDDRQLSPEKLPL